MKERRYSITREQAETIRLALIYYIRTEAQASSPYLKWKREQAIEIHKRLSEYRWEKLDREATSR